MSSFRVVSILSIVSISLILQSCSTPIVTITTNDDTQIVLLDPHPAADSEGMEMQETFSQLLSSILSPVFNKLLLLFLSEVISMIIGLELVTISAGGHFGMIVPQMSVEADLELHRSAMAVMDLWLQLPTVEIVETALQKATSEVGKQVCRSILKEAPVDPDISRKMIQLVLDKIELRLKDDPITYKKLTDAKARAASEFASQGDHRTYFASGQKMTMKSEMDVFKQWFSNTRVKRFLVNKLFAEHCIKRVPRADSVDYEYVLLAKALIRLAKVEERTVQVNRVYQEVVNELAEAFDFEKYKLHSTTSSLGRFNAAMFDNATVPVLFKRLNDKFSENATIYTELLTQRKNLIGDAFVEDFPMLKTGFW